VRARETERQRDRDRQVRWRWSAYTGAAEQVRGSCLVKQRRCSRRSCPQCPCNTSATCSSVRFPKRSSSSGATPHTRTPPHSRAAASADADMCVCVHVCVCLCVCVRVYVYVYVYMYVCMYVCMYLCIYTTSSSVRFSPPPKRSLSAAARSSRVPQVLRLYFGSIKALLRHC
jgi:hypothetical protein